MQIWVLTRAEENNLRGSSQKILHPVPLSPRRERIDVRGDMIWTSTPTLTLPRQKGRV
jgi:hypothetical protein